MGGLAGWQTGRRGRRVLGALALGLALLAVAAVVAALVYTQRASPRSAGDWALPGLHAAVQIERDAHGIPTIRAANLEDLMFGLGVVHAQDRLWQLEVHRRIGAGRLAEAFGPGALDGDRFLRALGVRRAAQAQWDWLRAQPGRASPALLEAYARGINAVVRALPARPPEMLILGVQPEDWTPVDSLAWATMMAWDLGGNWGSEMLRLRLALSLPGDDVVQRIGELLPPYPGERARLPADYAERMRALRLDARVAGAEAERWLAAAPESGVEGVGSNNWVLAGSRTTTGAPLLANDPHLKLTAPSLWYLVRLEAPGLRVAGASMPGLPGVVLGQNEYLAWGFTNTGPDVQDLYLEQIDPDDPTRYRTPEGWARFETAQEVIRVRGADDVAITVRRSRHGPVISDAGTADDVVGRERARFAIAMRWTALDADLDAVGVALAFNRARSLDEFVAAARDWVAPMQSMVVAERSGRIGMVAPGRVPLRAPDNDLHGLAPAPGWLARYDWVGWVPAERTPREFDPPRGWIATANQRIVAADYPYFLTADWTPSWRQQRIEQVLESRPRHSLADLAALQADVQSLAVRPLLPRLQAARSDHRLAAAAQAQLAGFDGLMRADGAAPLIYWAWLRQLTQAVFADELGPLYERAIATRNFKDALAGVLARDDARWCDDRRTPAPESCAEQVDAALGRALDELAARHGEDLARWRWSQALQSRAEHRPFSHVPGLARGFELRAGVGGDTYTVNVARVNLRADPRTGEHYLNDHGPSLRALYDLGDPARSRIMISTGQSGLPWSRHYRDLLGPWQRVDYLPLWGEGRAVSTLRLRPQSP
jgi:penicillin amidase